MSNRTIGGSGKTFEKMEWALYIFTVELPILSHSYSAAAN